MTALYLYKATRDSFKTATNEEKFSSKPVKKSTIRLRAEGVQTEIKHYLKHLSVGEALQMINPIHSAFLTRVIEGTQEGSKLREYGLKKVKYLRTKTHKTALRKALRSTTESLRASEPVDRQLQGIHRLYFHLFFPDREIPEVSRYNVEWLRELLDQVSNSNQDIHNIGKVRKEIEDLYKEMMKLESSPDKHSPLTDGAKKAFTLFKKPIHAMKHHQKKDEHDTEEATTSGSVETHPVLDIDSEEEGLTLLDWKIKAKELLKESTERAEEPNHFNYYYSQRTAGIGGLETYYGKVIVECQECIEVLQLALQSNPSDEESSSLIQQLIEESSHLTKALTLYQAYIRGDFEHPIHEEFFNHPQEYRYLERWIDSRIFDRLFPLTSQFSNSSNKEIASDYHQKLEAFYKKNENRFAYLEGRILLRLDTFKPNEATESEEQFQHIETPPLPESVPETDRSILSKIFSILSAVKAALATMICCLRQQVVED